MDPTTWAWIAVVVGTGAATLLFVGAPSVRPRHLVVPALAAASCGGVFAVAGSLLVEGWWPWGAAAVGLGMAVALLAEVIGSAAAVGTATSPPDAVAARLTIGMVGLGLLAVAGVQLLLTEVITPDDSLVALGALAVGPAATGAVLRIASIGRGAPRVPASEVVALVVVAPVAVAIVSGGDGAAVSLALAVEAVGVMGAVASIVTVRRGDRAVVLHRRTLVTAVAVALGGAVISLPLGFDARGVDRPRWLMAVVPVGAGAVAAVGQVMEWFTSDRWRPAKRVATRARAGAAAVITSGIGDAARATGWLLGILGVALVAAERIGRLAGDGALGMALMVAGAIAALGAAGTGLAFDALVNRTDGPAPDATAAQREAAEAQAASASAAAAIARGLAVAAAALVGFSLLLALGRSGGVGAESPGIWTLVGAIGGVAAAWYAVGWSSHLGEPSSGAHRSGSGPSTGAMVRRTLISLAMAIVPLGLGWIDSGALWVLLAGVLAAATGVALAMVVAAGSWENVRRLIETGAYGGATSRAHRAVVAADTVGERWREAAAPAVMALVVYAAAVAVAFAPLLD